MNAAGIDAHRRGASRRAICTRGIGATFSIGAPRAARTLLKAEGGKTREGAASARRSTSTPPLACGGAGDERESRIESGTSLGDAREERPRVEVTCTPSTACSKSRVASAVGAGSASVASGDRRLSNPSADFCPSRLVVPTSTTARPSEPSGSGTKSSARPQTGGSAAVAPAASDEVRRASPEFFAESPAASSIQSCGSYTLTSAVTFLFHKLSKITN